MRRVAIVALAGVALAGVAFAALLAVSSSSDGDKAPNAASTTATPLTPGFQYTDCSRIQAGDELDLDLLCDPANEATLFTVDCTAGIYAHLRRPEGDLEGIQGRTDWLTAGEVDAQTGRTSFAFNECLEGDY